MGRYGLNLYALGIYGLCCFAMTRFFDDTFAVLLTGAVLWAIVMLPAALIAAMVVKAWRGSTRHG